MVPGPSGKLLAQPGPRCHGLPSRAFSGLTGRSRDQPSLASRIRCLLASSPAPRPGPERPLAIRAASAANGRAPPLPRPASHSPPRSPRSPRGHHAIRRLSARARSPSPGQSLGPTPRMRPSYWSTAERSPVRGVHRGQPGVPVDESHSPDDQVAAALRRRLRIVTERIVGGRCPRRTRTRYAGGGAGSTRPEPGQAARRPAQPAGSSHRPAGHQPRPASGHGRAGGRPAGTRSTPT